MPALYPALDPLVSISDEQKTTLLAGIEAQTRALDERIDQVIISLSSNQDLVLVAASDGTLSADVRPLVRLNVTVLLEENGRREQGYSGGGARFDLGYFLDGDLPMKYAREAVRQAGVALEAVPAPAGTMPVVLGPGWPGILLHEAVGHGLEQVAGAVQDSGEGRWSVQEAVANAVPAPVISAALFARFASRQADSPATRSSASSFVPIQ